jgi:hypothetical protein
MRAINNSNKAAANEAEIHNKDITPIMTMIVIISDNKPSITFLLGCIWLALNILVLCYFFSSMVL